MTPQRRAWQRTVAGAALVVVMLVSACTDNAAVSTGAPEPTAVAATAIPTTAPAAPAAPATAEPSPIGLPTRIPIPTPTTAEQSPTVESPTAEQAEATPPPASEPTVEPQVEASPPTPVAAPTPAPVTDSQQVLVANGSEVYTLNCARCHGENGLGSAQYSAVLVGVGSRYTAQGMIAELTNGHPVTFGFADRLSPDEIASVVAYVKSAFP